MLISDRLNIDLKALAEDRMEFGLLLDDEYFSGLDEAEIEHGKVNASVSIRKATDDEFALSLSIDGVVTVACDLCIDDMEQPIDGEASFIVKLGTEPSEDDGLIVVDENQGILSLGWLIYETIVLAIPIKHVHAPGKCNAAMTKKLEELSATRSGDGAGDAVDPRWAELLNIKDNN